MKKNIFDMSNRTLAEKFIFISDLCRNSGYEIIRSYSDEFILREEIFKDFDKYCKQETGKDICTIDGGTLREIYQKKWINKNISKIKKVISDISNEIKLIPLQTIVLSLAFQRRYTCDYVKMTFEDCINYFNLQYDAEVKRLFIDAFIGLRKSRYANGVGATLMITDTTYKGILEKNELCTEEYTKYRFTRDVYKMVNGDGISKFSLEYMEDMCKDKFVKDILSYNLSAMDRVLLYSLIVIGASRNDDIDLIELVSRVYVLDSELEAHKIAESFVRGECDLAKYGLVEAEVNKVNPFDSTLSLTDKTLTMFYQGEYDSYTKMRDLKDSQQSAPDIIVADDIIEKTLYYNEENTKQINFLYNSMDDDNLKALRERLKSHNMRTGICAMLYGAPGTGKTETVLQIARQTNRNVMHVDISQSKSCWFGESEKLIKKIFTRYKNMCKDAEKAGANTPILLFNEADAIFAKRKDIGSSNVAQTENAMQNIILEEMENMEGILIATTNLINNLDPAFERRFLFKVKFDKPSVENKMLIWKNKIEWLNEEQCRTIAESFDFSGGEIENISRKSIMHEVLNGELPSFEDVMEMCRTEKLSDSKISSIGFKKAC